MPYCGPKDGLMGVHLSRTVLLFTVLVGHAAAVRLLVPEAAPCGQFLTETDVPGDTLTTVADTADSQACLTACQNTKGCNVAIRLNSNGGCFLKSVDASTVEPFTATAFTSYIICDAGGDGEGGPVPQSNVCNTYLTGQDILGPNTKSQAGTADNAACLELCERTPGCNAMVRVNGNGGCFLKTVDADNLEIIDVPWLTSYLICDGSGGGGTPTPPPPAPTPPPPEPSRNPWRTLKPIPVALGEVAADVLSVDGKDYLLVFGGTLPNEPKNGLSFIYDFAEDVWIEGGPRPKNGDHHNVEVMGNKLYMFGGLGGGSTGELQIGTLSAAPGNQVSLSWVNGPTSPLFTGSGNTAVMDGKALFCGGIFAGNVGTTTIPDCETYDPVTNSWLPDAQTPPDMIGGRNHAASCTDGSRFYVFGGRMGGNGENPGFSETQIYTPGGSWTLGAPLPLARGGMGSCACTGGKCYVFGGEVPRTDPPSLALKINEKHTVYRVDIYDIASNSWSLGTDMPTGMHGIYPVLHKGKIYIAGGGEAVGPAWSKNLFEYTPE